jgi:LysR family glycine cleavage system transcriptional activator
MRKLPSLNALRAFEAAARLGRMTIAAEELSVTHGAISRQIKALEAQLGRKLFEGPKNRLVLTEAGKILLPVLTSAFEQIGRGVQEAAEIDAGVIDVSCVGTLTMRWLIPRLHRFKAQQPAIDIRLSADDGPVDFMRQSFDVAIRVGRDGWPADAILVPLFAEQIGPVMSPRLLSGVKPHDELLRLPKLHTRTRVWAWSDWCARSHKSGVAMDGQYYEHFYFGLEAATAGLGIAIAPWQLVVDDMTAGRLVAPFGFIDSGQTYVALRRDRRDKPAEAFVAWLADEAAAMPVPLGFLANGERA